MERPAGGPWLSCWRGRIGRACSRGRWRSASCRARARSWSVGDRRTSVADMAGPVQILVVGHQGPIRNALKKFLQPQQFEVYAAGTGEAALPQLKRHRIALMLCDIRMPATTAV